MRSLLCTFALTILCMTTTSLMAQEVKQEGTQKPVIQTISAKVSPDGRSLLTEENGAVAVSNPETLKGRIGQQVTVRCRATADKKLHIISIKRMPSPDTYTAIWSDSAFRR